MATTPKQRYAKFITTPHGRAYALWRTAKWRADKKGALFTVTVDQIEKVISDGKCQLTNLPFDLSPPDSTLRNPYSPSIDRIDSSNPNYTPDNVRIVLSWVNVALSDYGLPTSMPIIKALSQVGERLPT